MIDDLLLPIWLLLPAAFANGAPMLASRLPGISRWDTPVDFNKHFYGHPLFGPHKTWRGIISGMIIATFTLYFQQLAFAHYGWARQLADGIAYDRLPPLVLGPLLGLGALGGDLLKSFFKRRRGRHSGESWIPFDQLDYAIGGLLATLPFVVMSLGQYVFALIFWFVVHLVSNYLSWLIGWKQHPI